MSELEEVLNQTETVEPEAEATDEAEQTAEQESVPAADDSPQMVPLAAKQAEKEKRQAAEDRARQAEAQLADFQRQQQKQNKVDIFDKPDEYMNQFAMNLKAQISEEMVKDMYDDYDSVMDHFETMVKDNPSIYAETMQTGMPAKSAYQKAKKDMMMKEIGDPSSYREKLKAELLKEIEAERKTQIPPDMNSIRNAGGDPDVQEIAEGTEGLHQLLGR